MIPAVHRDGNQRRQARYTLTETKHGQVWGVCDTVDGLFGEPRRGTYELFGWVPEAVDVQGWIGSRVWLVPDDETPEPWLLKGTRRSLNLEDAVLEIRDDLGELLSERPLWTRVGVWRPSFYGADSGADLIDLEVDRESFAPVPEHARTVWERWLTGPPSGMASWADLDTRRRSSWLDLVQERRCRRPRRDRPTGHAYALDGRHITDVPGRYRALGEAVNGPGGCFGGCLAALDDCLRGTFGYTAPATLVRRNAATAHEHLSHVLTPDGRPYDLIAETLDVLAEGGMRVTFV
ncbi:hypothetical protein ACGFY7_41350 [Streptomyces prunicolor]|uniref:hypothetical protein n=1 Tax=Streptomyces prunicolor TaxID=67348 RepID=UPI0037214F9D